MSKPSGSQACKNGLYQKAVSRRNQMVLLCHTRASPSEMADILENLDIN